MSYVNDRIANHAVSRAIQRDDRPFRLPPATQKSANRLLEQQFWLWGCDIRRQEGNILSELGFEKIKAPTATGLTTSQYRCPLSTTCSISLWGFGTCLGDSPVGSVFVPRAGWHPRYCQAIVDTATAWEPAWFERMPRPDVARDLVPCHRLVGQLLDWITWYEQRVIDIAGAPYRQQSIESWNRPVDDATPLARQWRELGLAIRAARSLAGPSAGSAVQ